MNTVIYQMQRVLIVVAMSAMAGYGEEPNSEDGNPSPKIEKTLVAHPGETLQVNSRYASQTIDSQAGNQVSVVVTRRVLEEYKHDANRILSEHKVKISSPDQGITIYTDVDDSVLERWQSDYDSASPLRVHVKVLVPKQDYDVVARTAFGSQEIQNINGSVHASARKDITINNVEGDLDVSSRYGGLTIRNVTGDGVLRAEARKTVDIRHVKGPHVNARSNYGSLTLDDIDGSVNATARKDVNISNVDGDLDVSSSYGGLTISNVAGNDNSVHASARKDIAISNIDGDLDVSSSYGGLTIRNVAGSVLRAEARKMVDIKAVRRDIFDARSSYGGLVFDDVSGVAHARARKAITVSNVGGDLSAYSSFGSVTIHHVGGSVRAEARGDIELKDVVKEASINSSFGKVRRVQ
ncbi:MAG: hypothetical protein OXH81_02115 [Gemmatimonadetes bacterium]|nr:hypothetical protein [Gemmatimonadota bacterium]